MKKQYTATVAAILDKRYETVNGSYRVRLRVTYERKQRYYPTAHSMTESDWNKMNGARPGDLKDILLELQDEERKAEKIIKKLKPFSFESFEKKFLNTHDTETVSGAYKSYISELSEKQPPQANNKKRAIPIDTIGKIYHYKGDYQKAKDFWLFSYFGNGLNMKDLCRLKYSDIDTDRDIISYQRAKTARTKRNSDAIEIDYTPEMKRIVKKYSNGGSKDDFIFPILPKGVTPKEERKLVQQFTHVINDHLKIIAEDLKIKPFTTYAARHAWSSVQRDAGVSVAAISKMLGHSDTKTTQAYLNSLDTKTIKMASKNLLAFKRQKPAKVVNI